MTTTALTETVATRVDFDRDVTDRVVSARTGWGEGFAHVVTITGNTLTLTALVVLLVVALAVRRAVPESIMVGAGMASGYLLMVALKQLVARDRPPVTDRLITIETHSFPSGHAMMSMIFAGLVAIVAYRLSAWVRSHRWVLILPLVWTVLVGASRIYLGVHWTTDVLAGWLFGAIWVALCALLIERYGRRGEASEPRERTAEG